MIEDDRLFDPDDDRDWYHPQSTLAEREKHRSKKAVILSMLQSGPCSTGVLANVTHRFACQIQALREDGHIIKVVKSNEGGGFVYRREGFEATERVTASAQSAYYRTKHWRKKRLERLSFDGWKCCWCHCITELEVHHWIYDLFNERLFDLMTLCRQCHQAIHGNESVHVAFPKTWKARTVRRLNQLSDLTVG